MAVPICLRLFRQADLRAASRALAKTGKRMAARMAMMAMTTSSSISVKPRFRTRDLLSGERGRLPKGFLKFTPQSDPFAQPFPRFRLHLRVELVRGVVETEAHLLRDTGLAVAGSQLLEGRVDAFGSEQGVLAPVDDEESRGHREGGDVRVVQVVVEA